MSQQHIHLFIRRHLRCFESEINKCCPQPHPPGPCFCGGLFFSSPLLGHSLCVSSKPKNETLYLCVWLLEVVRVVCVGQMACGSIPTWNRPSFVGDIMTYPSDFWRVSLLSLYSLDLCSKVEPSRNCFFFYLFLAGWGCEGGCVCRRLCS